MRVAITGASGFIGQHLTAYLVEHDCQIISLGRALLQEEFFPQLVEVLEGCDAVVNLAGAPINHYWTSDYKLELFKSRVDVTSLLVCALRAVQRKPRLMISTSAVGYYPSKGVYDEADEVDADGFLASLCRQWEAAARQCPPDIRLVVVRLGMVLSTEGGAMKQMVAPLVYSKCSVVLGSGEQAFPWIALQDVCRALLCLMRDDEAEGVYNLVSPRQITQKQLATLLAQAYRAWFMPSVPSFVLRAALGEMSGVLLSGQSVLPSRLLQAGFRFAVPTVEQLLRLS